MTDRVAVADLPSFEARHRAECTGPDAFVDGWENRDGFAHVNSVACIGDASGKRVAASTHWMAPCQRCKQPKIVAPLALCVRFEHALGRLMYWFGPTGERAARCEECNQK